MNTQPRHQEALLRRAESASRERTAGVPARAATEPRQLAPWQYAARGGAGGRPLSAKAMTPLLAESASLPLLRQQYLSVVDSVPIAQRHTHTIGAPLAAGVTHDWRSCSASMSSLPPWTASLDTIVTTEPGAG